MDGLDRYLLNEPMTNDDGMFFGIIQKIKRWYYRNKVISTKKAKELNLRPANTLYGKEKEQYGCNSVWFDENRNMYKVNEDICVYSLRDSGYLN